MPEIRFSARAVAAAAGVTATVVGFAPLPALASHGDGGAPETGLLR